MTEDISLNCPIANRPEKAWIVVTTKPRQERIAVGHLEGRGVEPYCPLFLEPQRHRWAPRGPIPLFPGYIFVACDPVDDLNGIRFCPGVLRPLVFDREPATVEQALIDAFRRWEGERGYIVSEDVHKKMSKGARVRVMGGPLQGFEGVFQGYVKGGRRVRILLDFLRSRRRVEVDISALALVPN
jgi:hypothetical protein